jgi:HTH-type transcriptional regulator/antitoxin HigA
MNAKRNTPQGDRLDVLVTLVEAWEAKRYPLDLPDARTMPR